MIGSVEHSRQISRGGLEHHRRSGESEGRRWRRKASKSSGQGRRWVSILGHYGSILCMRVLIPFGLLLLLAFGAIYFRLLQGPVSLKFLVEPVQEGIAAQLAGLEPSVDDVVVALKDSGGLEFRLRNLKVAERDGDLVIAAPYAAIQLSRSALLSLQAIPTRVELIEPQLYLSYSRKGGLKLQFSPGGKVRGKLDGKYSSEPLRPPTPKIANRKKMKKRSRPIPDATGELEQIDLSQFISQFSRQMHGSGGSTSYLQAFGLREATVILNHEGIISRWRVQQLAINLDHASSKHRMSGFARISSNAGPWSFRFRTDDSIQSRALKLDLALEGFFPRTLGNVFPQLSLLKPLDLPVSGNAQLLFKDGGQFGGGDLSLDVGAGRVHLPTLASAPINIDSGEFGVTYDAENRRLKLRPSTLRWGESSLTLAGVAQARAETGNQLEGEWDFDVRAQQGVMTVSEFGIPPTPIDEWHAQGSVQPHAGVLKLAAFKMAVGGGEIVASGEIDTASKNPGVGIEGRMSSMPVAMLSVLWPRAVAPQAREFLGRSVHQGRVETGSLKFLSGRFLTNVQAHAPYDKRFALAMELVDVVMQPAQKFAPVHLPRALVRMESNALEVVVPEGRVVLSKGKKFALKSGRFTAVNIDRLGAVGEIAFKVDSDLKSSVALLKDMSPELFQSSAVPIERATGKIGGDIRVSFPLENDVTESDMKFGGKMRLSDGRMKDVFGSYDISGATIDFDISESSIDARGEVLLNGVLAHVNWQRFLGAPLERQPPWRMTADLDDADRKQLDLDFGDALKGVVPVEFTIKPSRGANRPVHMRADLTGAELILEGVAWRKKPGRGVFLEADLVAGHGKAMRLDNLKLAGDNIAIAGTAEINEKNEIVAYDFPGFFFGPCDAASRARCERRKKDLESYGAGQDL